MNTRIVNESDIGSDLDRAIRQAACICFPEQRQAFARQRAWHNSTPAYTVLIEADGRILAHAAVVDRTLRAGNEPLRVAGIQTVFVMPDRRGEGLSSRVLTAAMDEAVSRGFDCGLLFCVPQLERVYTRCGWRTLPETSVTRIDADGRKKPLPGKNIAMIYPLKRTDFPPGPVHLQGNDW